MKKVLRKIRFVLMFPHALLGMVLTIKPLLDLVKQHGLHGVKFYLKEEIGYTKEVRKYLTQQSEVHKIIKVEFGLWDFYSIAFWPMVAALIWILMN